MLRGKRRLALGAHRSAAIPDKRIGGVERHVAPDGGKRISKCGGVERRFALSKPRSRGIFLDGGDLLVRQTADGRRGGA